MTARQAMLMLLLAILWSLQYIFMRVSVPELGAGIVADGRALLATAFLAFWAWHTHRDLGLRRYWKDHLVVGVANNVVPFLLLSWAAAVLPASYLSIIGGTLPLFTALCAAWLIGEHLGARRLVGFAMGLAGVALTVNLGPIAFDARIFAATIAGLIGSALWAWASVMIKQRSHVPALSLAGGSTGAAALLMLPFWLQAPPPSGWSIEATVSLFGLGILCSGVAYIWLFSLIRDIGPSRTLTVSYIVPVFGVAWGWLLLDEAITLGMIAGTGLVIGAMPLVLRR